VRYVVTGAAGFIGSHLADKLADDGHEVVAVDVRGSEPSLKPPPGVQTVETDLGDDSLDDLLRDAHGVFHLAGQPGVRTSWGQGFEVYLRDNILVSQRLFEAAARADVRVTFASSSSIYGDAESYPTREDAAPRPISPYGVTKLACEHLAYAYARTRELDVVTLRYFTVYGPGQRPDMAFTRLLEALAEGAPFEIYGDGTQSRDFTYVDDAVEATIAAMQRAPANAVYNVGGGTEATLRDVITLCEGIAGSNLNARFTDKAAGDVRRTAADTSRIRGELGWLPKKRLEDGLRAQWQAVVRRDSRWSTTGASRR